MHTKPHFVLLWPRLCTNAFYNPCLLVLLVLHSLWYTSLHKKFQYIVHPKGLVYDSELNSDLHLFISTLQLRFFFCFVCNTRNVTFLYFLYFTINLVETIRESFPSTFRSLHQTSKQNKTSIRAMQRNYGQQTQVQIEPYQDHIFPSSSSSPTYEWTNWSIGH